MGNTLSVTTGFGFAVPPEVIDRIEEKHEDDEMWDGFGEYIWKLSNEEELLEGRTVVHFDYSPHEEGRESSAVFVKSTVRTEYGAGVFHRAYFMGGLVSADELNALDRVATKLEIEEADYEYLTTVSYG